MRTVLFDLDNTVWDWVECWYNAFVPYVNRVQELTGVPVDSLIEMAKAHNVKTNQTLDPIHPSVFGEVHNPYLYDAFSDYCTALKKPILYPEILITLNRLRDTGIRLEYVTGNKYAVQYLTNAGILRLFDGGQIVGKKTADCFKRYSKPCLMIGDSYNTDLAGAKEAGCFTGLACWGVPHPDHNALLSRVTHWDSATVDRHHCNRAEPDYRIKTPLDILEIINDNI